MACACEGVPIPMHNARLAINHHVLSQGNPRSVSATNRSSTFVPRREDASPQLLAAKIMQGSTRFQSVAEPAASKLATIALCQRSAIRGLVEVRCWRRSAAMNTLDSNGWLLRMPTKVNSLWPNPRPLIALHSPYALLETGPRTCHPEKSQHVEATRSEHSLLSSAVCLGIIAKYGNFPVHFVGEKPIFSAVQTAWRRERDSNRRYPFRYSGFQDRLFQPLTHPSAIKKRNTGSILHSTPRTAAPTGRRGRCGLGAVATLTKTVLCPLVRVRLLIG